MMKLVVATRNAGKLKEIRRLLESRGISILGLEGYPDAPEVVEDGETFAENAIKKLKSLPGIRACRVWLTIPAWSSMPCRGARAFTRQGSPVTTL